ncbi:MAG: hotdog fold domain-containing protein [Pseudomonadota bacterium]
MAYKPSKSPLLKLWKVFGGNTVGHWFVSRIVCIKAPYFSSITPRFKDVRPGRVEIFFRKRRRVLNHLGTVHAIAMCNAAELAGGTCLDVSLNSDFRWIPVGMQVQYVKLAKTDLRAICEVSSYDWESTQDVVMPVSVTDTHGIEVFHADITMRISPKR